MPCLDGLRGLAVLVVLAHHADLPFFSGGHVGVDVFFVLSGFLITSLLLDEWNQTSGISLRKFYSRRALRLFPALFGLLFVAEIFALLRIHGDYFWTVQKAILGALFYVANWVRVFTVAGMGPFPHTWSLSIEEQFYLLWPLLLLVLLPRLRKSQMLVAIMLIVATVAVHRSALWSGEASWERIYNGTDTRFDELLVGCAAAIVFSAGWLPKRAVKAVIRHSYIPAGVFVVSLIAKPMAHRAMAEYGWILIELSVAVLLCRLVSTAGTVFHRTLQIPPLVWIGRISYGLYLWHLPIFEQVNRLHLPYLPKLFIMFLFSFSVAGVSYYLVERPFLKVKSQLRSSTQHRPSLVQAR